MSERRRVGVVVLLLFMEGASKDRNAEYLKSMLQEDAGYAEVLSRIPHLEASQLRSSQEAIAGLEKILSADRKRLSARELLKELAPEGAGVPGAGACAGGCACFW